MIQAESQKGPNTTLAPKSFLDAVKRVSEIRLGIDSRSPQPSVEGGGLLDTAFSPPATPTEDTLTKEKIKAFSNLLENLVDDFEAKANPHLDAVLRRHHNLEFSPAEFARYTDDRQTYHKTPDVLKGINSARTDTELAAEVDKLQTAYLLNFDSTRPFTQMGYLAAIRVGSEQISDPTLKKNVSDNFSSNVNKIRDRKLSHNNLSTTLETLCVMVAYSEKYGD